MKKKVGKTIGDAAARVQSTRAEYYRALIAYKKWLMKEVQHLPDSAEIPEHLKAHFSNLMKGLKSR